MTRPRRGTRFPLKAFLSAWALVGGLSGCASSPKVAYFTLEPIATHDLKVTSSDTVQVVRVHLPPTLDRKQMVRHSGAYTLDISDQHRWSAPLDQMVRRVLTEDLMRMLPPGRVILPEEPAPPTTAKIVVDIVEFAPDASGTIQLDATWSLLRANSHDAPQNRYARLSQPADANDAADQVGAMSRILDRFAIEIAQSLAPSGSE